MTVRRIILAVFLVSAVGGGVELLLLGHTETAWQLVPLVLLAVGTVAAVVAAARPARVTMRAFQGLMGLFVVAGLLGLYLHYSGNVEFEREMYPSLAGLELFRKAITGATPALAPAFMLQLGALGLAWSYMHPRTTDDGRRTTA